MAVGFTDPRVTLHICDGIKYVQDSPPDTYDLIVVDSSDPVGPAEVLFEKVGGATPPPPKGRSGLPCTDNR
jgi:spermidine synthase